MELGPMHGPRAGFTTIVVNIWVQNFLQEIINLKIKYHDKES